MIDSSQRPSKRRVDRARGLALALGLVGAASFSCAPHVTPSARYPQRAPGCDLTLYHTSVPGVALWDDLGVAESACHISTPEAECMRALRAEACRMGGDIIYNVPRRPYRPQDQAVLYRGQVAHSRPGAPQKEEDQDIPAPASPEESAGPVVPLEAPAATDAGTATGDR
jgi:hypothetical protein